MNSSLWDFAVGFLLWILISFLYIQEWQEAGIGRERPVQRQEELSWPFHKLLPCFSLGADSWFISTAELMSLTASTCSLLRRLHFLRSLELETTLWTCFLLC